MGVEIALATILALGGAGVYLGLKTIENYSPGRRKIQKDLKALQAMLKPLTVDLVPWSREEMEQLSFNLAKSKSSKRVVRTQSGVFTTIYHEPLVAWVYRRYVSSKENAVIIAKTSHREFTYRIKKGQTDVALDGEIIGQINDSGALTTSKGRKVLGSIARADNEIRFPINALGREVGGVTNVKRSDQTNPRAFSLMGEMSPDEESVFLALALIEMVRTRI